MIGVRHAGALPRAAGSRAASYQDRYNKRGGVVATSYYEAPVEIYDDPEEAAIWARRAYDAALRAKRRSDRRR